MKVHNRFIKAFGALLIAALLFGAMPAGEVKAQTDPVHNVTQDTYYTTIQAAIDSANPGDVIEVSDGTYDFSSEGEPDPAGLIKVSKPVTIKAADDGNDIRPVINGTGADGVFKIWHSTYTGGQVVIEGFEITGDATVGIAITAAMCDTADTTKIIIRDNLIHGMIGGFNAWGSANFCTDAGDAARAENIEVVGNEFSSLGLIGVQGGFGVYLEGLSDWSTAGDQFAAKFDNNVFRDIIDVPGTDGGVGVAINSPNTANNEAANARISGNIFESTVPVGIGILAGDVTNSEIVNNSFAAITLGILNQDTGTVDATRNYWGAANGPVPATQLVGSVDFTPWYATATTSPTTENVSVERAGEVVAYSDTIQGAVDAASAGDTIEVEPGTYSEKLTINVPNLAIKSTDGADATIIDVPDEAEGVLNTGVKIDGTNLGEIIFDGFTVKDFTENGIVQGMAARLGTTFHVLNNIVTPKADYLRNGIQVSGDGSVVIGNTVQGAPLTEDWAGSGIMVVNASNVLVEGNTLAGEEYGLDRGIQILNYDVEEVSGVEIRNNNVDFCTSAIYVDGRDGTLTGTLVNGNTIGAGAKYGVYINGAVNTEITDNDILAYYIGIAHAKDYAIGTIAEYNRVVDNSYPIYAWDEVAIDASPNWWGSITGPSPIFNNLLDYIPWCGDAECSFLVYPLEGEITGTVTITEPITYLLKDGTVINTGGACFDIQSSNVTIMTETPGGAVCYPGSPGIQVAAGESNIIIEGLEIDGKGTAVGNGIDFLGAVTDVIISDTFIHDMDGDAVHFTAVPAGYVEIKGNLFKNNTGVGVNNEAAATEADTIDATYNAWGDYDGPTDTTDSGDGVSAFVTYASWTHVDVYVADGVGTRYVNEVALGEDPAEEITYNVYANLQNAFGAQFTLSFDPTKLQVLSTSTDGTVFPWPFDDGSYTGAELSEGVTVDSINGKITFNGGEITAVSGEDQFLFSVTFKGAAATDVDNPLFFDEADVDLYGMNPTYGSSLNIYADELVGVEDVNVYDLPTLWIDPLATFAVGNVKEFTLTVTNPVTGRAYTDLDIDLSGLDATLEYWDGSAWVTYTQGDDILIGELAVASLASVDFRIIFTGTTNVTATVNLEDDAIFLVTDTFEFTVLNAFTVTGTVQMQGRTERAGVLIELAHNTFAEYIYDTLSTNIITDNYTLLNVADGLYTLTITHDRYLDFVYTTYSTADLDLARLELRGGDVEKDNLIDIFDASLVGLNYGSAGNNAADANFDGTVNIQDLAMIGGNFDLSSATAYTTWVP